MISCVRANASGSLKGSLGFVTDGRRMNVAITRARHYMIIVGNARTLEGDNKWRGLIDECKAQGGYQKMRGPADYTKGAMCEMMNKCRKEVIGKRSREENYDDDESLYKRIR